MTKNVVLYHANCQDGTGAAFAAWKKFGDNAVYLPVQYGKPLPEFEKGPDTTLYLLDFSVPSVADLEALGDACGRVVVCDHHVTARDALGGCNHPNVEVVFDMERSGAVIAWNYFHPDAEVPLLLQYVQDRDLWKFEFPDTQAVHAGLGLVKGPVGAWNKYAFSDYYLDELTVQGDTLLERDKLAVEAKVPNQVKVVTFNQYEAGILNTGELVSEVGEAIYNDATLNVDFAIMWFVTKENEVILSMRSKKGGVNVGEICKKFGGGGHQASAGCKVDFRTLQYILDNEWF